MKKICILDMDMTIKGGVESVTATLSHYLSDKYKVYVLSLCMQNNEWAYELNPDVEKVNFTDVSGTLRVRQMYLLNAKKVRAFLKREKIDVILLMGTYMGFLGSLFCIGMKTKVIFCDHGSLMNQWEDKSIRFMRWVSSRLSDFIVTLTEQTLEDYIQKFHVSRNRIQCIYNGIEESFLENAGSYNAESKLILTVGRFGEEKGYDMLVEVARIVLTQHSDWQWHIYGTGETFQVIAEKVKEYHMENQLLLKGQANNMKLLYPQYAMLVLTSYREGLPLVLLEGKVNRLPLVSFDIMTGPREIITDGVDGILVEPQNVKSMAQMMNWLIEEKEQRKQMSGHSRDNLNKFEIHTIIKQWEKLIEMLSKR